MRRTKVLPPASFRPHLTMDPLPLAVCLLWSYRTRDFHPLDYTHAGRTPPYPASRDFPLFRGQNKPLYTPLLHSTHSAPALAGERWWRQPPKGGCCFPIARQGGCEGFINNGAPYFQKSAHHGLCPLRDSDATLGPCAREALIKSLSNFILAFLFNARNKSTRIASYLRRLMTRHWIKIHMKFDSAN